MEGIELLTINGGIKSNRYITDMQQSVAVLLLHSREYWHRILKSLPAIDVDLHREPGVWPDGLRWSLLIIIYKFDKLFFVLKSSCC